MKQTLSIIFISILLALGVFTFLKVPLGGIEQGALLFATQSFDNEQDLSYDTEELKPAKIEIPQPKKEATLLFVGDIMLDRGVEWSVDHHGEDYQFLFKNIVWPERDITFANLEGAAARSGTNQGSIYSFHMNPDSLSTLAQNNFSILSVANNHIGDWGAIAADETVQNIKDVGMKSSGWSLAATSDALVITEKNGIRIGFLAFSEFNSGGGATKTRRGILLATASYFEPMIREASQQVDVLIVSLHSGTEYAPTQNAFQERIARKAIDAGARIVMGHHPHVVEPVIEYNNGLIAYSLGNFIFDQGFSTETTNGGALLVNYNADKKTLTYKFGKTIQNKTFAVEQILWEPDEKVL